MTVKPARKPRRLSQKQRAERIAARQRALEKVQAELVELEAQEEAYQAKRLDEAWVGIRKDLTKALDIEDAEDAVALREALQEQEVLAVLRAPMTETEEEAVELIEEGPKEPYVQAEPSGGAFPWQG